MLSRLVLILAALTGLAAPLEGRIEEKGINWQPWYTHLNKVIFDEFKVVRGIRKNLGFCIFKIQIWRNGDHFYTPIDGDERLIKKIIPVFKRLDCRNNKEHFLTFPEGSQREVVEFEFPFEVGLNPDHFSEGKQDIE